MSFWNPVSWFTSTEKATDTAQSVIENGMSAIDKMFYTEEEKAENANKVMDSWLKMQHALRDESSVRSITRRFIALAFVSIFLLDTQIAVVLLLMGEKELLQGMISLLGYFTTGVGVILFFYFSSHAIGSVIKMKKQA